ncbi:retrovirus-related pol polyprotein from transposon TNT 1-94 [Tanacetum coccineum]
MDEAYLVIDEAPQSNIHAEVKSTCYSDHSDSEVFRVKRRSSIKPQHRKTINFVPSKPEHQMTGLDHLEPHVEKKEPVWIVFEVLGSIKLASYLNVSSYKTIDGQGQRIKFTSQGLRLKECEHVIVCNLEFKGGRGRDVDAIKIKRNSKQIWIRCSLQDYDDGLIDIIEKAQILPFLDLEVAFRKHTCFVRNLEGDDLLRISKNQPLYIVNVGYDGVFSDLSPVQSLKDQILVMAPTIVTFELCKKQSHKPKSEGTNQEKLYLLHMDLCGPMRVASINGKKYILVIVDDYSRFIWVKFIASKDEAPDFIIKFLKMIQVRLNKPVWNIRTDNGTEFVNQTLRSYYKSVGISHETSVGQSPQQNDVVERRNHTLVEATRTMLIYAKAPLFLWAKAVATASYTQNRSIIRHRYGKTPYELLHDRKPDLSYLYVVGALCYLNNDSEDLGKL